MKLLNVICLLLLVSGVVLAEKKDPSLPSIAAAEVPLYPPLARSARVQGVIRVKVTTDGQQVISAKAKEAAVYVPLPPNVTLGPGSLQSTKLPHSRLHTYRIDTDGDPNYPVVLFRFPTEIEVTTAPLILSDPPPDLRR